MSELTLQGRKSCHFLLRACEEILARKTTAGCEVILKQTCAHRRKTVRSKTTGISPLYVLVAACTPHAFHSTFPSWRWIEVYLPMRLLLQEGREVLWLCSPPTPRISPRVSGKKQCMSTHWVPKAGPVRAAAALSPQHTKPFSRPLPRAMRPLSRLPSALISCCLQTAEHTSRWALGPAALPFSSWVRVKEPTLNWNIPSFFGLTLSPMSATS